MNDGHWFSHLRVEKRTLRSFKQRVVLGLAILLAVPSLWAHHSFAAYDQKTTLMLSGTLKRFDWGAPHATIFVTYTNDKGEPGQMAVIHMGSPSMIAAQGFTPADFQSGMKVELSWHPHRNGSPGGELVLMQLADGRVLRGGIEPPPKAAGSSE